jgi:hypothetical protein
MHYVLRDELGMNLTVRLMFHEYGHLRHHCAEIPSIPPVIRTDIGLSSTGKITQAAVSLLMSHTKDTIVWGHTHLDREKSQHPSLLCPVTTMSKHLWPVMGVRGLVTFHILRKRPQQINLVALLCLSTNAVIAGKDLTGPAV